MQDVTLAGLSILIVEDETLLRKQISAHLEKLGADVTGANTLEGAKRFLANLDFDLVLLDVNLPDGRGTDLLKEHMFPANTGVIVMTAEGAISGAVEAMRLGALDYLVKPFDPAQLPLVVGRAQRNKRSARLEELRSVSPAMQAKVLTAIEDRKIRRLGGTRELPVDVRIIAATNRDLKQLVAEGKFRQDLFHRLDLFRLHIPPLRERGDDILKLAETLFTRPRERHHLP